MKRLVLVPLLALCVFLQACSTLAVAAATVNGQKLTENEVEEQLDILRGDPVFGDALRTDPDERGRNRRAILSRLIYSAVADQQASRLGIETTGAQVDRLLKQRASAENQTVDEFLEAQNLSNAEGRRIARQLVRDFALQDEVLRDVRIDAEDVRAQYDANRDAFSEIHLQVATLKSEADARGFIEELEGEPTFADLAADRSSDSFARNGGDMGFVLLSSLPAEVQTTVGAALAEEITEPIQTANGFQVYRVLERRTRSFEDAAPEIRAGLLESTQQQRYQTWLRERVLEARVVVNPKYGVFDRQQAQVIPAPPELQP